MNFLFLTDEKKLKKLKERLPACEEDVFLKILEAKYDPDTFDPNSFMEEFKSIVDEIQNPDYESKKALNEILKSYFDIKNQINNLES